MKRLFLFLVSGLIVLSQSYPQQSILNENFGTSAWDGNPMDFPNYSSDASFSGDDSHAFAIANSAGYSGASGGGAVLMGNWTTEANTEFVMLCNTEEYISIRLSFGMKHNSGGWGTCQLSNNFTLIEYSTNGTSWTSVDKARLMEGSSWPCAEDNVWAFIELAEVLPSSATLYIRFTHTEPTIHPYYLDDITLTGYVPDLIPPTAPDNLAATKIESGSFILSWNASIDEGGINYYKIFRDGKFIESSYDTIAKINYQLPGSSSLFSVIAYDIADNPSEESIAIPVNFEALSTDHMYSWERKQSRVLPSGEMEWTPKGFEFIRGSSERYIDYENGDDSNDGLTKASPWQHHPWDLNASSLARAESGIHTYIFKRGVIYRGQLIAKESGTPLEPIRLTSDPSWGSGEARFFGSVRLSGEWIRADAESAPNIPHPEKVWYQIVTLPATKMVVELDGDTYKELHVARSPNYEYTPDDPLKTWFAWTGKTSTDGGIWLRDNTNLVQTDPAYYSGATVFSQENAIVMCTVWKQEVMEWDPENKRLKVSESNFGGVGARYFIENTPFLLDTTNEYYYNRTTKRLFLRMEGDKDPNNCIIEAGKLSELIRIDNKHDIEISGLAFGITTAHAVRYGQADAISAIRMTGICNNINVNNNTFQHVAGGVSLSNAGSTELNSHSISVNDNDFQNVADLAIVFATSTVYLDDINIMRNNIYNNGYRHQGRWYSSIPAIYGQLNYGEIAGNIIDVSWGNGIDMFWGKGSGSTEYVPFIRGLIHHNSASNTLIGTNDYGGIESWQGGPAFCYNNFSHNASGYKHFNSSSIGYAYYFDGSFKHIVFNNIASGVSHNRNSASIMQVLGYYNMYVHNSAYNTNIFFNAWKNNLAVCGHNAYLANVAQDVNTFFKHEISPENIPFDSYGYNISSGNPLYGSIENLNDNLSLVDLEATLNRFKSPLISVGYNSEQDVLAHADSHDFRAMADSKAMDNGVKFFTAFPLARVVGEWNFYKHPADLSIVMGDNFYMTEDFSNRDTYKDVPKNHLTVHNYNATSFVNGALEDWVKGALVFDGSVYCSVEHVVAAAVKSNNIDMTDNDFIIEAYFRIEKDHAGGVLVSKFDGSEGYELGYNEAGFMRMSLYSSGAELVSRLSSVEANDSLWHHVLVEVNRNAGIDIYIDGKLANAALSGVMPAKELSLSNPADLFIGKDIDDNFFLGTIDFLRISKGSLYDARTTVDEIYTWETDGPFLYDIKGAAPLGKRDAGALEIAAECDLQVSEIYLDFENSSTVQRITAKAGDGLVVRDMPEDFFSLEVVGDTLFVAVEENTGVDERSAIFTLYGCSDSQEIKVIQSGVPCTFVFDIDSLFVDHTTQSIKMAALSNETITIVGISEAFLNVSIGATMDSILIVVEENLSAEMRSGEIQIKGCDEIHSLKIVQDGLVGVNNYYGDGGMEIYPNPVSEGLIYLVLPSSFQKGLYTITELSGKNLQNGVLFGKSSSIDLAIKPGTYILSVEENDRVYKSRLLVM